MDKNIMDKLEKIQKSIGDEKKVIEGLLKEPGVVGQDEINFFGKRAKALLDEIASIRNNDSSIPLLSIVNLKDRLSVVTKLIDDLKTKTISAATVDTENDPSVATLSPLISENSSIVDSDHQSLGSQSTNEFFDTESFDRQSPEPQAQDDKVAEIDAEMDALDTSWEKLEGKVADFESKVNNTLNALSDDKLLAWKTTQPAKDLSKENKDLMLERTTLVRAEKALLLERRNLKIDGAGKDYSEKRRHRGMKTQLEGLLEKIDPTVRENVNLYIKRAGDAASSAARSVSSAARRAASSVSTAAGEANKAVQTAFVSTRADAWSAVSKAASACASAIQAFAKKAYLGGKVALLGLAVVVFAIPATVFTATVQLSTAAIDKIRARSLKDMEYTFDNTSNPTPRPEVEKKEDEYRQKQYEGFREKRTVTLGNLKDFVQDLKKAAAGGTSEVESNDKRSGPAGSN